MAKFNFDYDPRHTKKIFQLVQIKLFEESELTDLIEFCHIQFVPNVVFDFLKTTRIEKMKKQAIATWGSIGGIPSFFKGPASIFQVDLFT